MRESFEKYYRGAERLGSAANSLWAKVTFISVAEIVSAEVDLKELDRQCWTLKDAEREMNREVSRKMDSYPEEEYFDGDLERIDGELYDLFSAVSGKLDAIDEVITALSNLSDQAETENYAARFEDISSIQIEESHQPLKIRRFQK